MARKTTAEAFTPTPTTAKERLLRIIQESGTLKYTEAKRWVKRQPFPVVKTALAAIEEKKIGLSKSSTLARALRRIAKKFQRGDMAAKEILLEMMKERGVPHSEAKELVLALPAGNAHKILQQLNRPVSDEEPRYNRDDLSILKGQGLLVQADDVGLLVMGRGLRAGRCQWKTTQHFPVTTQTMVEMPSALELAMNDAHVQVHQWGSDMARQSRGMH